jgi:NAD+ kinase
MDKSFNSIALVGLPRSTHGTATHTLLYHWLSDSGYQVLLEPQVAQVLGIDNNTTVMPLTDLGQQADLVVVIGGDGNLLSAAQTLVQSSTRLIGVNRGHLGFLTDLDPDTAQQQLAAVLAGHYQQEQRLLLQATINRTADQQIQRQSIALNEVVLHPDQVAHLVEFEVYIDNRFAFAQRADGLILSTPTGSTAYSLSAGGPILTPTLNAMLLMPMFPQSLSARPLVIDGDSCVQLYFSALPQNHTLTLSCDGHIMLPIRPDEHVIIQKSKHQLSLIHPIGYDYFNRLSDKLGWLKKLF